jgi:molybdopterin-containing oxidoreductase family iron-sulfur binding subunit
MSTNPNNPQPSRPNGPLVRIEGRKERKFWRSVEEFADTPEFRNRIETEFPSVASEILDPFSRRTFLKYMGASLALAGVSGCAPWQPDEKILPYVRKPEGVVPGRPLFFASAMPMAGYATGVLVESHEGRPTKLEGNPQHPASLGATDLFTQAAVLSLYDPDRAKTVLFGGRVSSWDAFLTAVVQKRTQLLATGGAGLRILTEAVTSPTLATQIADIGKAFPQAKWYQYEPVGRGTVNAGNRLAFGEPVDAVYAFDKADVVVSLDSNFLFYGPGRLRYARDFARKRRLSGGATDMNRLYSFESSMTITGAMADHHVPVRASLVESVARAIAQGVGVAAAPGTTLPPDVARIVSVVVRDLLERRGASIVIPGEFQSPAVHALAHAINAALGNVGSTVTYIEPVEANPVDHFEQIRALVDEMNAGAVDTLLILSSNPVHTAPADLNFLQALDKVPLRILLSSHVDETAAHCHWHVPEAHFLESWSDLRAFDGTTSIVQPLIAPLFDGRSAHEILAAFLGQPGRTAYDTVKALWAARAPSPTFEAWWQTCLHDGVIPNTAAAPKTPTANAAILAQPPAPPAGGLEVVFRPDSNFWDGRWSNNAWLMELPRLFSKVVWDNAIWVSPNYAQQNGLLPSGSQFEAKTVRVSYKNRTIAARVPVWVQPGMPDDSATLFLGFGRTRAGQVGNGVGFDVYTVRTSDAPWFDGGLELAPDGDVYQLVTTQEHFLIHRDDSPLKLDLTERGIVRTGTIGQFKANPGSIVAEGQAGHGEPGGHSEPGGEGGHGEVGGGHGHKDYGEGYVAGDHPTMLSPYDYSDAHRWAMSIDMQSCIGCNACMVACQSENNIAVVGKQQVSMGREMHWIRIDTYYNGEPGEDPDVYFQPVTCQQCENAPCEVVCPVNATTHSAEGLNDMVYNRCVGTRYCSNNCPYKVRRFNFLYYSDQTPLGLLGKNPDVTVRTRGVMEKCTYCVQRISLARIDAETENRRIKDYEVLTACQQVCPTEAIVFGDLNDPESRVSKLKKQPLDYGLLTDLNTHPRTTYSARVRNPHPDLGKA